MTEEEWLTDRDPERWLYPERMLDFSERKLRLFCVACCRRIRYLLFECGVSAVEAAENYADGRGSEDAMRRASEVARAFADTADGSEQSATDAAASSAESDIRSHAFPVSGCASKAVWIRGNDQDAELAAQADLLRDIFGNPFRPVTFSHEWRTDTALSLARQMYESRDFGAAPILADALQDAGCDSDELLSHLRDTTATHVRGCWAVDLVLGKE